MRADDPSATALLVAGGVAFHSTHPRYQNLVPAAAGELSRRFVSAAARLKSGAARFDRFVVAFQEALTVPGISLHYVLRKRAIEDAVRKAIADGFRRLIVLGAGLDTLAIRLSGEIPATEIDHPATQRLKREVAGSTGVEFRAVDFTRHSLADALPLQSERAVVVAEAVFLYLTEEEVSRALADIRKTAPRARLIFSFWAPRVGKSPNFQNARLLADLYLAWKKEPGKWGIAPERIGDFLAGSSFVLRELLLDDAYQRRYLPDPPPLPRGEHIAICDALPG